LEHATKVVTKAASAHKQKTRRAASGFKEGMENPKNNND
jgi:deferrochelatase/peroxidase EfeB